MDAKKYYISILDSDHSATKYHLLILNHNHSSTRYHLTRYDKRWHVCQNCPGQWHSGCQGMNNLFKSWKNLLISTYWHTQGVSLMTFRHPQGVSMISWLLHLNLSLMIFVKRELWPVQLWTL